MHLSERNQVRIQRGLMALLWIATVAFCLLRCWRLGDDFPNGTVWADDGAKFTDEGWWASAAVDRVLWGHWTVPGDYNPCVALPVYSAMLSVVFRITGVSIFAARGLNVALSIATIGLIFVLIKRFTQQAQVSPPLFAVLLLAVSPFAYAYHRLAILESLVVFLLCLLFWLASFRARREALALAFMTLTVTAMLLTKTTSAVFLPGIAWVAVGVRGWTRSAMLRVAASVFVMPALLLNGYMRLLEWRGYGADLHFFYDLNELPDIEWHGLWPQTMRLMRQGWWVDRGLYPMALAVLLLAAVWKRKLWRNPLFCACWLGVVGQSAFLFARQGDVAPRYFVPLLLLFVIIAVLMLGELCGRARAVWVAVLLGIAVLDGETTIRLARQRQHAMLDAAMSIKKIVEAEPEHSRRLLGVSAADLSLMTGLSSINDVFGTDELGTKIMRYKPGWYVVWTGLPDEYRDVFAPYRLEKVAEYQVFDVEERQTLLLYRMTAR